MVLEYSSDQDGSLPLSCLVAYHNAFHPIDPCNQGLSHIEGWASSHSSHQHIGKCKVHKGFLQRYIMWWKENMVLFLSFVALSTVLQFSHRVENW